MHKNPLPWWSYQLSFSKRPEETLGDQGLHAHSVTHSSPARKAAALVMVITSLLFKKSKHLCAVYLCSQLVLVHPHVNVSKKSWLKKQNVQYNGWISHSNIITIKFNRFLDQGLFIPQILNKSFLFFIGYHTKHKPLSTLCQLCCRL